MGSRNQNMKCYKIEDNPYNILYLDPTLRCQMKCTNCYNRSEPDVDGTDVSVEYYEEVLKRIPQKAVDIRLCGGEPTLHPEFFKLVDLTRQYGHMAAVVSNGLKYQDDDFMKEVKKRRSTYWAIALNGGFDINGYERMDGGRHYYHHKMKALNNLLKYKIRRVALNHIILRGVNEDQLPKLIQFCLAHSDRRTKYLKLRSLGHTGRQTGEMKQYLPYTGREFKEMVHKILPEKDCRTVLSGLDEGCKECCYRFYYKNIFISFSEFASYNSTQCWLRGKIKDDFTIKPFFDDMVEEGKK
jgi:MoaA/NifB/PqqE/SkfB family radical SAM enzyme